MAVESKQRDWSRTFLPKQGLNDLVSTLRGEGYDVVAPTLRDGVISMQPIDRGDQIVRGMRDEHDGGHYRLVEGDPDIYFDYVVGPDGPKRYFFPPQQKLFSLNIEGERFVMDSSGPRPAKLALIGVRPCELAAIQVQDRVFGIAEDQQTFRCESETYYQHTREQSLLIAVNCTRPGGTCFCASWDTGPEANRPFDLALTELPAGFVVRIGTPRGEALVAKLPAREATSDQLELERLKLEQARHAMGRRLDVGGVKQLLEKHIDHPRWDEVAERCLSCGNCTMVCPTCFCSTVTDANDLATGSVTRSRQWESCFTHEFSYTTPGPVRNSTRAKYRQWLRHKLCTWWDQFDCSGCVGCGRCITWCPVGIDLTDEIDAIRGDGLAPQKRSQEVLS